MVWLVQVGVAEATAWKANRCPRSARSIGDMGTPNTDARADAALAEVQA